jgi:hypothetical protein
VTPEQPLPRRRARYECEDRIQALLPSLSGLKNLDHDGRRREFAAQAPANVSVCGSQICTRPKIHTENTYLHELDLIPQHPRSLPGLLRLIGCLSSMEVQSHSVYSNLLEAGPSSVTTLPSYTRRETWAPGRAHQVHRRQLTEHEFHLSHKHSEKPWLSLTLRSRAPSSKSIPAYLEGEDVAGNVLLNLEHPDHISRIGFTVSCSLASFPHTAAFNESPDTRKNNNRTWTWLACRISQLRH